MGHDEGRTEIVLTDEEFARRVKEELTPERLQAWPATTNPAIAEAVLRALGFRIVDAVDQADFHWVDTLGEAAKRIVLRITKDGDTWSVGLGN